MKEKVNILGSAKGFLTGKQVQPMVIADLAYNAGWEDAKVLTEAVAISLAESWGWDRAYCDNIDDKTKKTTSRDCGLWQINVRPWPNKQEEKLYDRKTNAKAAHNLWQRRGWQPWVSYNRDIYLHDHYYIPALLGVVNFLNNSLSKKRTGIDTFIRSPFISRQELRKIYPELVIKKNLKPHFYEDGLFNWEDEGGSVL